MSTWEYRQAIEDCLDDLAELVDIRADPRPSPQVAADYGTTAVNIRTIRQRRSWDWL